MHSARGKEDRRVPKDKVNLGIGLVAKRAPVATDLSQQLVLVEWEGVGEEFFGGSVFASKMANLRVHVFVNKTEKMNVKVTELHQMYGDQVVLHMSLTESKEGPWTDLLAFLINFHTKTLMSCLHCAAQSQKVTYQITVVSGKKDRYTELKALLKSEKGDTKVINGYKASLLDLFPHVCYECKIIFPDVKSAAKHDKNNHNFLCRNPSCQYSKRENGFFNYQELAIHEEQQRKCVFCKRLYFCDDSMYNKHMKDYHVWCNCSCEKYYKNKTEFLEHYCHTSPLPCLESPECESRFKNIDEMAFHHKQVHGSAHPYYCIACYSRSKLTYVRTAEELMAHISDANHELTDFELVIIPSEELVISNPGSDAEA